VFLPSFTNETVGGLCVTFSFLTVLAKLFFKIHGTWSIL